MTGASVIQAALRMIGVIGEGETPSASESQDALTALNAMLDAWNNEKAKLYTQAVASLSLTTATQAYTWGTGGTFNTARPVRVDGAIAVVGDASENTPATDKVRIPIDLIQDGAVWAAIRSQTAKNTFPEKVYVDGAFPLRNVKFWPVPTFAGGTAPSVEFWIWTALTAFADLTTAYTLPPGYELAFKCNLAILLAPEYGRQVPQSVLFVAKNALDGIAGVTPDNLPTLLLNAQAAAPAAEAPAP